MNDLQEAKQALVDCFPNSFRVRYQNSTLKLFGKQSTNACLASCRSFMIISFTLQEGPDTQFQKTIVYSAR